MSAAKVHLANVLRDARSGFASGDSDDAGIFQMRMNNVTKEGMLDFSKMRRVPVPKRGIGDLLLEPGDVLFNATNSPELVGKTAFISSLPEKTTFSNHFIRLRPTPDKLAGGFLARWLQLQFSQRLFQGMCRQWVNQAAVSQDALLSLRIPLPPIEEQRRIAAVLDQADALRARRREAIAHLGELTGIIFLHMFGDPVVNPKGLPLKRLGDVGTLDRGVSKHRPRNAPELLGGDHPLIQTGDVANSGGYIREYHSSYSEIGLKQSKKWPAGTLCITIAANIAKTGILTFDACFPDSVVGFSADSHTVLFVQAWLSFLQETLEEKAPESAQKNISLAILRSLPIPLPPLPLQQEFARRVETIERLKASHRAHLAELDTLFASLQSRAFRGEL